jgi:alpha-L-fucosidase
MEMDFCVVFCAEAPKFQLCLTLFAYLHSSYSPVKDTVLVNDRWGVNCRCRHGGSYTCVDRFDPGIPLYIILFSLIHHIAKTWHSLFHTLKIVHSGILQKHKWENAMTVDKKSWGFRREAKLEDFLTIHELISKLAETVR